MKECNHKSRDIGNKQKGLSKKYKTNERLKLET